MYGPRKKVEHLKKGDFVKNKGKVFEVEVHNEGPLKGKRVIHYEHRLKGDLTDRDQVIELDNSEKERLTYKKKYF